MTDDEKQQVQAQRVLEMLAGLHRCSRCGKLGELLPRGDIPNRIGDGPLLCAKCYRVIRFGQRL